MLLKAGCTEPLLGAPSAFNCLNLLNFSMFRIIGLSMSDQCSQHMRLHFSYCLDIIHAMKYCSFINSWDRQQLSPRFGHKLIAGTNFRDGQFSMPETFHWCIFIHISLFWCSYPTRYCSNFINDNDKIIFVSDF